MSPDVSRSSRIKSPTSSLQDRFLSPRSRFQAAASSPRRMFSDLGGSLSQTQTEKAVLRREGDKSLAAFREAGLTEVSTEDLGLLPPFTKRLGGTDTWELVDANGEVGVWVQGEDRAEAVVKLLNAVG